MYSPKFSGSKAVDYQCSLLDATKGRCLCAVMKAVDIDSSLTAHEQVFRRILKYVYGGSAEHDLSIESQMQQQHRLIVLVDETGLGAEQESSAFDYSQKIESFLRKIWNEAYSKV